MTDYFAFFGWSPQVQIDVAALKQLFLANNRRFHPDFHTLASPAEQAAMLEQATLNNLAYQTLLHPQRRIAHLLALAGKETDAVQASPDFLMDAMEVHEQIEDLNTADELAVQELLTRLEEWQAAIWQPVAAIGAALDLSNATHLSTLQQYEARHKAVARLQQQVAEKLP